ncbi:MAG: bacteriohemerythrin [Desulfovibrionaceae bacterium]
MPLITWRQELSVGREDIDAQHKSLISMINDLDEQLHGGAAQPVLADLVDRLKNYAQEHFASEEQILEQADYPELLEHQREHIDFIRRVSQFDKDCRSGACSLNDDVLAFLKTWLVEHIMGTDQKYVPHLQSSGG